ncbi:DUF4937 domain-containing protein [Bacillus sp. FJAT-42376]|nr:DUF4937 domain-containing protein [Bacillus sp. FJAT-42376]
MTACIYSFWAGQTDYQHFMEEVHDRIFASSEQEAAYTSIQISLYQELQSIPDPVAMLRKAGSIHAAFTQNENFRFDESQRAKGMLGGTLAFSENTNRFLRLTGWENEQDQWGTGELIQVEEAWRVTSV